MDTDLRMVILDPNSDFVRLGTVRGDADPALAGRYRQAARGVVVLSADAPGGRRLRRMRPTSIRPRRPPCSGWTRSRIARSTPRWPDCSRARDRVALQALPDSDDPRRAASACVSAISASTASRCGRAANRVGPRRGPRPGHPLRRHRPGLAAAREEQSLVAAAVLGDLWRRRQERQPVLIVIDEAHNVCPADRPTAHRVGRRARHPDRRRGPQVRPLPAGVHAAPAEIAENVLSQADNLVLMRLNSLADTAFTQAVLSFSRRA